MQTKNFSLMHKSFTLHQDDFNYTLLKKIESTRRSKSIPSASSRQSSNQNPFVISYANYNENADTLAKKSFLLPTLILPTDNVSVTTEASDLEISRDFDDTLSYQLPSVIFPRKSVVLKKIFLGFGSLLILSLTSVTRTQLIKTSLSIESASFYAPYFLTWFNANWLVTCFPIYVLLSPVLICNNIKMHKTFQEMINDSKRIFSPEGITRKSIVFKVVPFAALLTLSNYTYNLSLAYVTPTETAAIFASGSAFVYLLSWVFLHEAFMSIRIVAIVLSTIGIVLMAHAEGRFRVIFTNNFTGIIIAVISSAFAAIQKVFMKRIIGNINFCQLSFLTTIFGVINLTFNWIIALILLLTKTEQIFWYTAPWQFICASASLTLVNTFWFNLATSITHELYLSVGLFLAILLNAAVDANFRESHLNSFQWAGSACILISYLLMLITEKTIERLSKIVEFKKRSEHY